MAFALAPRLNAAGRLGQPQLAVELLVTERAERANELAQYIDQLNASRQTLERSIFLAANKQAKEDFDPEADVGAGAGRSRLACGRDRHRRRAAGGKVSPARGLDRLGPVGGETGGRLRPQRSGLQSSRGAGSVQAQLVAHGGHAAAAGLKIEERRLEQFRAEFCQYASLRLTDEQRVAELHIDAEVPLSGFTAQTVEQMEKLAPFGHGNARPLLCTTAVTLAEPPRTMGGGGRHLSLRLSQHGVTLSRRGVWRRRLGRAAGRASWPHRRGLPAGHQRLSRSAERRTAIGRLAAKRPAGRSSLGRRLDRVKDCSVFSFQ